MTRTGIATKHHRALESTSDPAIKRWLEHCHHVPYFVIEKELQVLFNDLRLQSSVGAMFEADVAHLPYPQMCLELWNGLRWRYFVLIRQDQTNSKHFEMELVEFLESSTLNPDHKAETIDAVLTVDAVLSPTGADDGRATWRLTWSDRKDLERRDAINHCVAALNLALAMGHMGELEREVIEPKRSFNNARAAKGKVPVQNHVIVRIGHVYDHQGRKVNLTEANRRTMPVHMRAGHTRRQNHGPQWVLENKEEAAKFCNTETMHIVYIPPVLVNFNDGSELPLPKTRLVKL